MKITINYSEIKATMRFVEQMDPISYGKSFSDDSFDSVEKCIESINSYNKESEGLITFSLSMSDGMRDESGRLVVVGREHFRDDDEFIMEMDSELYNKYCSFLAGKMAPIIKLILAIVEFIASFSDDCEEFFKGIWNERKLARLEKENNELKEKAENDASEKEAQDQCDEHDDDAISMEELERKCDAIEKEARAKKKAAAKDWGKL